MDLKLKSHRALVFGSTGGIGAAISKSLIREECSVVINGRDQNKIELKVTELKENVVDQGWSSNVFGVAADLSKPAEAKRATEEAIKKMDGLDILIMNTGGPNKGKFEDISSEQWFYDFQNLWISFVEAVQVALPVFKKQNYGRILLVTSLAAKEPLANLTTSNGLRAGLSGLAKSLANEVAAFNVTVNVLLPGYTNTDRLKELKLTDDKIKEMIPMGRLGEPSELADLATFLVSPKAGYITGQNIAVDGGVLRGY